MEKVYELMQREYIRYSRIYLYAHVWQIKYGRRS